MFTSTTNGEKAFSPQFFLEEERKSLMALSNTLTTKEDFETCLPYLKNIMEGKNEQAKIYALVLIMHFRDIEEGKGLRKPFLQCLQYLYEKEKYRIFVENIVEEIPKFGYYKDLCNLFVISEEKKWEELQKKVIQGYKNGLDHEFKQQAGKNLTNCGKFAPRQQKKYGDFAKKLAREIFGDSRTPDKDYRKYLQEIMKKYKQVTEVLMSNNDWDKIDPQYVPSLCFQKFKKCFLNEEVKEEKRLILYGNYMNHIQKSLKNEAKINAKRLNIDVLIPQFLKIKDQQSAEALALEAQVLDIVNDLKKKNDSIINNCIAICDVSGSMTCNKSIPLYGSIGLGLIIDELNQGRFEKNLMTFHENPTWISIGKAQTFYQRIQEIKRADWGGSTDFHRAMELVAKTAQGKKEYLPTCIFVFSDMQFNCAQGGLRYNYETGEYEYNEWLTTYSNIENTFEKQGYDKKDVPAIVFWNLAGDTKSFTVDCDQKGVIQISGYSQSLLKGIMNAKDLETLKNMDPLKQLVSVLEGERYAKIKELAEKCVYENK